MREERVCPECDRGMAMDDKNAWCDECAADDPLGAMIAAGGGEVTLVPEGRDERYYVMVHHGERWSRHIGKDRLGELLLNGWVCVTTCESEGGATSIARDLSGLLFDDDRRAGYHTRAERQVAAVREAFEAWDPEESPGHYDAIRRALEVE